MNYNIKKDIDIINEITINNINERIIIPTKNYYCSNCNKRGHTFKKCNEPIISNGIISFCIEGFKKNMLPFLENYIITNINKKIKQNDNKKLDIFDNKIKYLMVQRKHSLGYLEFMRGRYNETCIDNINYLLEQMTPTELNDLNTKDFDYLWNNLWSNQNNFINNQNYYKEYITSKQKFIELKLNNNINFNSIKTLYNFNEWGFPKGRRELYEADIVCAMREFEEETNYNENNYTILDNTHNIKENLVGTNGIDYKHNYFLALIHENKINIDNNNKEIGDIKIMDIHTCLKLIRPYHSSKIKIINKIHNLISNFLLEYDKNSNSNCKV